MRPTDKRIELLPSQLNAREIRLDGVFTRDSGWIQRESVLWESPGVHLEFGEARRRLTRYLLLKRKEALADASILVSHFCLYLWTFQRKKCIFFGMSRGKNTEAQKSEILQGTLDLMVLKVLDALGP